MKKRTASLVFALAVAVSLTAHAPVSEAAGMDEKAYEALKKKVEEQTYKEENHKKDSYKEGQAIVLYKDGEMSSKKTARNVLSVKNDVQVKQFWHFEAAEASKEEENPLTPRAVSDSRDLSIALVTSDTLSTEELIAKLKKDDNVEVAEPNYKIHAEQVNDAYFNRQWGLENTGQNGGTVGASTNVSKKWEKTTGSDEAVVAVVDTGVDYTHEDLKDNMWINTHQPSLKGRHGFDFVNNDDDPMDDNGHGTHCAGVIGATGDNGIGISGINQKVKIMALKMFDHEGKAYGSDEISAYYYINRAMGLGVNVVAINNSWGGVTEPSEIFEKLINLVGERGAVSVCAAGNEGVDKDSGEAPKDYPVMYESAYKLNVAATTEKNELASFSNYGKESIDLGAPGMNILSTVSYDCYNPSIYDLEKQKKVSEKFNDFEGIAPPELKWENGSYQSQVYGDVAKIDINSTEEYFGEKDGHSLKFSFKTYGENKYAELRFPYTLTDANSQEISVMAKANAKVDVPESKDPSEIPGGFLVVDIPKDKDVFEVLSNYEDYNCEIGAIEREGDRWYHLSLKCGAKEQPAPVQARELCVVLLADQPGEYEIYLDDIGLSRAGVTSAEFEKYDFYDGTSMAAPYVTGAIALEAAENPKATAEERIHNILSSVKEEAGLKDKLKTGGTLDFSQKVPVIGDVSVDCDKGEIRITGAGFDAGDLEVKISCSGEEPKKAEIKGEPASSLVVLKDEGWINKVVDISVTANGKTDKRQDVYLVKGKTPYEAIEDFEFEGSDIMATDGEKIYSADSEGNSIHMMGIGDSGYESSDSVFTVNPEKYFQIEEGHVGSYDFGKDLVCLDGSLYNIAEYSQAPQEQRSGEGEKLPAIPYWSQYKLMSFDLASRKIRDLGELPDAMKQMEDWTLTEYKGKLYLIGGYDCKNEKLSKTVMVYDPSIKKWESGPDLP